MSDAIATAADLARAVRSSTFRLFGVDIRCHVLDTGRRVIEAASLQALLEAMGGPDDITTPDEIERFARWQWGQDS